MRPPGLQCSLVLCAVTLLTGWLLAPPPVRGETQPSRVAASIRGVPGPIYVRLPELNRWQEVAGRLSLRAGDEVLAPPGARLEFQSPAGILALSSGRRTHVRLGPRSLVLLEGWIDVQASGEGWSRVDSGQLSLFPRSSRFTLWAAPGGGVRVSMLSGLCGVQWGARDGSSRRLVGTGQGLLLPAGAAEVRTFRVDVPGELHRFAHASPASMAPPASGEPRSTPSASPNERSPAAPADPEIGPEEPAPGLRAEDLLEPRDSRSTMSLRARLRSSGSFHRRMRAHVYTEARSSREQRTLFVDALDRSSEPPGPVLQEALYRREWREKRGILNQRVAEETDHFLAGREALLRGRARRARIKDHREELAGQPLLLITRARLDDVRAELANLQGRANVLARQIAATPAGSTRREDLEVQRGRLLARAHRIKDQQMALNEIP